MQKELFVSTPKNRINWVLPNFIGSNLKYIALDTETDGLDVTGVSVPVGLSIYTDDHQKFYIPWAHENGFNFEFENVRRWALDNLCNLDIQFCNAKFDINGLFKIGIDLESLNCVPHDIANSAALLDSKRTSLSLNNLSLRFLQREKVQLLGRTPIHIRSSEEVWFYAVTDAELTFELAEVLKEEISKKELGKVAKLEDELIYAICYMERKGVYIDREKLEKWQVEINHRKSNIFWQLFRESGVRVEPTNPTSVSKLCNKLGIEVEKTETGKPSIKNEWLRYQYEHPLLHLVYVYRKLSDLESDYIHKYLKALDGDNRIRYNLNQLKSNEYGTVTGRFSSSGSRKPEEEGYKINIQQVVKVDEGLAADESIEDFPIRELFIPDSGYKWLSADASQLQFRIFAHYSDDIRLINEYRSNPNADFHGIVSNGILGGILCEGLHTCKDKSVYDKKCVSCKHGRSKAKHVNFGMLFRMGVHKLAIKLRCSYEEAKRIMSIYHSKFPSASKLGRMAEGLARNPSLGPHPITAKIGRGYVKTISGRRREYGPDDNLNSAINAVIQGTEADIMKDKIIIIYNNRKQLDFEPFFTVHDAIDGQTRSSNSSKSLKEILDDHTSFETRFGLKFNVPIIWSVKLGDSWNV